MEFLPHYGCPRKECSLLGGLERDMEGSPKNHALKFKVF